MKKLKAIFMTIISVFALVALASCSKKANIEIVNISAMRTRIGVTIKVDDPKSYITSSSIKATLYETDDDGDTVETLTFDSLEEDEQTQTFDDLERETTYKLVIKATVDDKSKTFYSGKITTTNEGSSSDNPIHINTTSEFLEMSYDDDAYYVLDKNLDFTTETGDYASYTPMFDLSSPFLGHLDGNGKTIKGLDINNSKIYNGLFGALGIGSSVTNLTVENVKITSTKGSYLYLGTLAGSNQGTIENVIVKNVEISHSGTSTSRAFIGGLVGVNSGIIKNSSVETATINARTRLHNFVGGFAGINGGVVQNAIEGAIISNCFATGITIVDNFESIVKTVKDSSSNPNFFSYAGGFVGESRLTIEDSYSDADITVKSTFTTGSTLDMYEIAVGGFAGRAVGASEINRCAAKSSLNVEANDAYTVLCGTAVGEVIDSSINNVVSYVTTATFTATADYSTASDTEIAEQFAVAYGLYGRTKDTFITPISSVNNLFVLYAEGVTPVVSVNTESTSTAITVDTSSNTEADFNLADYADEVAAFIDTFVDKTKLS